MIFGLQSIGIKYNPTTKHMLGDKQSYNFSDASINVDFCDKYEICLHFLHLKWYRLHFKREQEFYLRFLIIKIFIVAMLKLQYMISNN